MGFVTAAKKKEFAAWWDRTTDLGIFSPSLFR
jgi:hypothetical protein